MTGLLPTGCTLEETFHAALKARDWQGQPDARIEGIHDWILRREAGIQQRRAEQAETLLEAYSLINRPNSDLIAKIDTLISKYEEMCKRAERTGDNDGYITCDMVEDLQELKAMLMEQKS